MMRFYRPLAFFILVLLSFGITAVSAQNPPATLAVDMRDAAKHIFHAKLTLPVKAGPLTLVYPRVDTRRAFADRPHR